MREPRQRGGAPLTGKLAVALASAMLCGLAPACDAHSGAPATSATCRQTRYLLRVDPSMIVSNERHDLRIQAKRDACGRRSPARGGSVRLGHHRATTDSRGRATLTVRLATGRYTVRLYVRGRLVAGARVNAIPNVSR
jgi:hypothetical protein